MRDSRTTGSPQPRNLLAPADAVAGWARGLGRRFFVVRDAAVDSVAAVDEVVAEHAVDPIERVRARPAADAVESGPGPNRVRAVSAAGYVAARPGVDAI